MTDRVPLLARPALLAGLAVGLEGLVGAAALYGGAWRGNAPTGPTAQCRASEALAGRLKPLAQGEVAALVVPASPRELPALSFKGPDGEPVSLADYRGRTVLLNLWATWCVPCRKEMPALDRLEAELGGPNFTVVAINMDTRDAEKPKEWLKANNITRLAYLADPDGKVFQTLRSIGRATGLPTTLLIDKSGCLLAHLDGPAEWASSDATALIRAALGSQ
jgi:thiol-disulfide isomerase/thioredoxin